MRGSIIFYQGEELGLPQVDVPFERLRDPEAIANWPHTLSRDGARTPMPWSSVEANLGFSKGEPWLPAGGSHSALAVDRQAGEPESLLHFTQTCLQLRHARPALHHGSMTMIEAGEQLLVFDRGDGRERLRCTFNLSDRPAAFRASGDRLIAVGNVKEAALGPYAALIEQIA